MQPLYAMRAHTRGTPRFLWLALALSGWLEFGGHAARAAEYTLTILAKTGDTIDGKTLTFVENPDINSGGTVAFIGGFSDGLGIFTQSSLLVKTGDTIGGQTLTDLGENPDINNGGTVAFIGASTFPSFSKFIFTQSSLLAKPGDTIGGQTLTGFGSTVNASPDINNGGTVAFWAFFSGGEGIFTTRQSDNPGSQSSLLVKTGDTIGGQTLTVFDHAARINDRGTVAFLGLFPGGEDGIFTQSSLLAKTGDTIGGQTLTGLGRPAINNRGTVAFAGGFSGGSGIFTTRQSDDPGSQSSLLVKTGDTIGSKTLSFIVSPPDINNRGTVAFFGGFSGGSGIFTQSSLVAKTGDVIGGQTLTGFGGCECAHINDAGDIVFGGTFSDGSQAIILAQMTPENRAQ
jgi:hypothetical protein